MNFLKKIFQPKSNDEPKYFGGVSIKEINAIKKQYSPSVEYTKSQVRTYYIDKKHIIDYLMNGFDVIASDKITSIPFLFYAKDQETFDIMVHFGANPDINKLNLDEIAVIKMSLFFWEKYWDELKDHILSMKTRHYSNIRRV